MMTDQFFDSSDKAVSPIRAGMIGKSRYPWETVPPGKSFMIADKNQIKFKTLRSLASSMGKKFSKKFRAVEHENCYEVACLKMTEEQAIQTSSNVVEALGKIEGE